MRCQEQYLFILLCGDTTRPKSANKFKDIKSIGADQDMSLPFSSIFDGYLFELRWDLSDATQRQFCSTKRQQALIPRTARLYLTLPCAVVGFWRPNMKIIQRRDKVRLASPEPKLSSRKDAVKEVLMDLHRIGKLFLTLYSLVSFTSLRRY
jgi:hypothetical protein